MTTRLAFPDPYAVADLATLADRAQAIAPGSVLRLQGVGPALACYAGILDGTGLFGEGLVVGLRVLAVAEPTAADIAVTSATLAEVCGAVRAEVAAEVAAGMAAGTAVVELEPDAVPPRWAAQAPPRSGWEQVAVLDAGAVHEAARSRDIRAQVEGLPAGVTHGMALALRGLGLLPGDPVLHRNGPWLRLSTPAGHVLAR